MMYSYGQPANIRGRTIDTVSHHVLAHASISLLWSDSILLCFTYSSNNGSFVFSGIPSGDFLLLITHPQFSERWVALRIPSDTSIDLDRIALPPRSSVLDTAIVTQRRLVFRLKGDTMEYDAANVKTKINASVEDLLKRLPGIQVDQHGVITTQGERVQKVLVDGEEFFSEDPTIATRNLKADMVDKVQVLNKRSAQAEFTGIDDGKTTKILNLTLREDKKHGWFGKVEGGTDADQYYNGSALAGAFEANRKISAFGMVSNTGQSSLSVGNGQSLDDGEYVNIPGGSGGDNFGVSGASGGIPQTISTGVHYSNKWNGDGLNAGQHLSSNYRYNGSLNNASSYSFTQQTLPDSIYAQAQQVSSLSNKVQHTLSGIYDVALDSSSCVRISFGGLTDKGNNQAGFTDTTRLNSSLVNSSYRHSDAHIDDNNMISSILLRKKFSRAGQTFSANAIIRTIDQHTHGYLYSLNYYYHLGGASLPGDTTDQKKDNSTHMTIIEGDMLYTTPLGRTCILEGGYNLVVLNNQSLQSTWNKGTGKYDEYVDSLSNQYAFITTTQQLKLTAQIKNRHLTCTFGGELSYSTYRQTDLLLDTSLRYHYLNAFPYFLGSYRITPSKYFSLYYYGSREQPSIDQLQPTKNNNDPLNIVVGNPGLQPAFNHSFSLRMVNFNAGSGRSFYAGLIFGFRINAISSRSYIDSLGRTVTQAVNVNGNRTLELSGASSWDLRLMNLRMEVKGNLNYARAVNFINDLQNFTDNYLPTAGFSIGRDIPDKYNFSIGLDYGYTYSFSSINTSASTRYWNDTYNIGLGYTLPGELNFGTTANYSWHQKINAADNSNEALIWNASLDKRFAKNTLTGRLAINDILDQNNGFTSTITANQIVQSSFTTIRRYWLLSLIWNFSTHPKL